MPIRFLLITVVACIVGCAPSRWTAENALAPGSAPRIFDQGSQQELIASLDSSLAYLSKLPAEHSFNFGPRAVTRAELHDALTFFKQGLLDHGLSASFYEFVERHFEFFTVRAGEPLFTGYYQASIRGSRRKKGVYRYPVYGVPPDLLRIDLTKFPQWSNESSSATRARARIVNGSTVVPYHDRHAIDFGQALAGKKCEIAWTDDPIKLFFMQIQGSGVMTLDDGKELQLAYGDTNGELYRPIGKYLVEQGALSRGEVSMQSIVNYLRNHPERYHSVTAYNPSYVFFREANDGPIGSIGQKVTTLRSIATDLSLYPRGALAFIALEFPNDDGAATPFSGFVLNQDSGGAIKGPLRVDLFTGRGEAAESLAGKLQQRGELYFLLRKGRALAEIARHNGAS